MNLGYDVVIFLNDAEDQGENYTLGAEAWADNLSEAEIAATQSFILLQIAKLLYQIKNSIINYLKIYK